jgi:hypothetical protein
LQIVSYQFCQSLKCCPEESVGFVFGLSFIKSPHNTVQGCGNLSKIKLYSNSGHAQTFEGGINMHKWIAIIRIQYRL